MSEIIFWIFIFSASFLAIAYCLAQTYLILKKDAGTPKMQEIALAIEQGALAYLRRQYLTILAVAMPVAIILGLVLSYKMALGFLLGAFFSALCGFWGMLTATKTNVRVAAIAHKGLKGALNLAFAGGSVTGFAVVGLALLSLTIIYLFTRDINALIGLSLGGSLISIFARLGGGIFTKAADVGADLVGKIEAGFPEDDPRNPAVIADNVGDNVGDDAGMAADLFETYLVTATAAILLSKEVLMILSLGGAAILASFLATFFVRLRGKKIMLALYGGLLAAALFSAILFYPLLRYFHPSPLNLYLSTIIGLIISAGLVYIAEFFTGKNYWPVRRLAAASETGHATNVIAGLALSLKSTFWPLLLISAGIFASFQLAGLFGIALASFSMLSLTGMVVAIDAYGPITDNAGGIAEMAGLSEEVRKTTDALDAVGNTTKAVTKSYAIGSAGLAALVLFTAYVTDLNKITGREFSFSLFDTKVLIGLFIGGLLPYIFSAYAIEAVGKAAGSIVKEVRRQFKNIPGILEGKAKPDYKRAVDIVTREALIQMILPGLIPIVAPLIVGFILGPVVLGGLLVGAIVTGLFLAISMTTGGAAWDNAKKYIEEGNLGGKGSLAHQASITGDTVGDPYKDTAGPAINPMIKVLNIVALLIISFIV
ncbi:sodium-translocating pyrophosphatase [Candidatus Berkelbacteria bacterium]|nr:sodium-translocating pyrophosphatase [Candidatus Berkelbacteria bacterium]MBI2588576.1 sodium-translocating pyrophosphatase [Candidatus Berkelbacteria bacterium]MBI4029651.1 sodium-translocating pyrophosphatase [Candidatus Berkelbacteria bacterium]